MFKRYLAAVTISIATAIATAASSNEELRVKWVVPADQLSTVVDSTGFTEKNVAADLASEQNTKGLPLLYIVAGIIALPDLIHGLVSEYKNLKSGTTIITCIARSCNITHDPAGPPDTVVIKDNSNLDVAIYRGREGFDEAKWAQVLAQAMPKK